MFFLIHQLIYNENMYFLCFEYIIIVNVFFLLYICIFKFEILGILFFWVKFRYSIKAPEAQIPEETISPNDCKFDELKKCFIFSLLFFSSK